MTGSPSHSRRDVLRLFIAAAIGTGSTVAVGDVAAPLRLLVAKDGWGDASSDDVAKVLESAAGAIWPHMSDLKLDPIDVRYGDDGPIVYFKRGPANEHQVRLNVRDTYWAQYAFQFAHEFCHILCGYRPGIGQNKWFEESLCELASLFAIRSMARSWETTPPYPNWKSFAPKLAAYAEDRMKASSLPNGKTLAAWYADNAEALKLKATDRERNLVVATALLPLFEANPKAWDAVKTLNEGDAQKRLPFKLYLANWRAQSKATHHELIDRITTELGV